MKDTSKAEEQKKEPESYENDSKVNKKSKIESIKPKETLEQFFLRKQKETGKVLSPRMKNVFNVLLPYNDGNYEKTWSELWA
jgi:hypothetical protein